MASFPLEAEKKRKGKTNQHREKRISMSRPLVFLYHATAAGAKRLQGKDRSGRRAAKYQKG